MSSRFQRFLLPGFAFKAVVIGGGYATGRELAEFFLPSGPWGGITAMLLATLIWSGVCVATFLFARATGARDYQSFVRALLGPGMDRLRGRLRAVRDPDPGGVRRGRRCHRREPGAARDSSARSP